MEYVIENARMEVAGTENTISDRLVSDWDKEENSSLVST